MRYIYYLLIIVFYLGTSCSDDVDLEQDNDILEKEFTVNRENQYALNVVFFKPSDFDASPMLIDNVSTMMLYIQKWYEKQMELQGYGKKTFGLMTRDGKVNIILISAPKPAASYPGHSGIIELVDQYFLNHPDEKRGDHTFVLGSGNSGVPFYGLGKWCFATSNDDFSLTSSGKTIDDLELMLCDKLGGIMHELGHGLNLPHNCQKASDLPEIALMSFGNHTYQTNPELVFLTKATCALLNVSQTFNTKEREYYAESPEIEMKSYSVVKDDSKKATLIDGLITTNLKPTHFWIGHDGVPSGGGNNYDNITWSEPFTPTGKDNEYSFHAEMPYSDIFNGYKRKDTLRLEMIAITENGMKSRVIDYKYTMDELNQVPNDDIQKYYAVHELTDRSDWVINANSSSGNTEINMIDGMGSTYWHSKWPWSISTDGNHVITVDMGSQKDINGIFLSSYRSGGQYRPKHLIISASSDNVTWSEEKAFTTPSIDDAREVSLNFDKVVNTRYVKIVVDQVYISNGNEENLIITELDIL